LLGAGCGRLSAPGSASTVVSTETGDLGGSSLLAHPSIGLSSAYPDVDSVGVGWRVDGITGTPPAVALFISTTRSTLFDGTPNMVDPEQGRSLLEGLVADTEHFIGLSVQDEHGDLVQSGPVLRARTGAPIYCDASSTATAADGLTPATAFADLQIAIITAFLAGGGNVWIASGVYPDQLISLPTTIHLFGGFPPGFTGADRDPVAWPTTLTGRPGATIVAFLPGDERTILDGVTLDGLGSSSIGVEIDGAEVELRSVVSIRSGFGGKFRAGLTDGVLRQKMVACSFNDNSTEGVSVLGSFDFLAEACEFSRNSQEGFDAGPLIAPDAGSVQITVRDCVFVGNGADGLDIDLNAPLAGGLTGGTFEVRVEDCAFETNLSNGFLIDIDYELAPLWRAEILVLGCETRANGSNGGMLDLDSEADVLVHRLSSSANRGDGLLVTSELHADTLTISSSTLVGNGGVGARLASGFVGAVFGHCIVAGNLGGGLRSEQVESLAHSTVFYEQPAPTTGVVLWSSVEAASTDGQAFLNAPEYYTSVSSIQGSELRLSSSPEVAVGDLVEVLDDRTVREVTAVSATGIEVDPGVGTLTAPFSIAIFAPSAAGVVEDYQLTPASLARGTGMALPFGAPIDAGVFGAPEPGVPGQLALLPAELFVIVDRLPKWHVRIGPMDDFDVCTLGGVPDPATFAASIFAIETGVGSVPITFTRVADGIVVHPPAGGWVDGSVVEFHRGLQSIAGVALGVPAAFPVRVLTGN
jgi:hypothetical protein